MTDREAMQKALEALEWNLPVIEDYGDREQLNRQHRAITALRERLAQPEPVIDKAAAIRIATVLGWEPPREEQEQEPTVKWDASAPLVVTPHPAFQATQQRREWVGLTDEEVKSLPQWFPSHETAAVLPLIRAIEAKLREKNNG